MDLRTDVPHGARIWNYWLGGKDNFAADRAVGDAVKAAAPAVADYAVRSRGFLARAVRCLAESGVRQYLDIGTGLPTAQNTHEVAQSVAPDAKVVYVDNDPLVLAHARALLRSTSAEGDTLYVDADYRRPDEIIEGAAELLDLDRPVAVLFMGVLGYLDDADEAHSVVHRVLEAVPPGSYLALWDGTDTSPMIRAAAAVQAGMGSPYRLRRVDQIERWFDGLELVEPGLVPITSWRPADPADGPVGPIDAYGGVARKPA
ncbi:SAM-dependent methyltransferase [Pseudonocardia humida]|uniref:SAM-dependent methyltransferase n=1 Tax=Pseudonocardia humida TaxID=2800819 RepID=A0ABT0ZYT7_9PSEU|nr:SAM-dependent methyltransferase [Pseudonocardia humida]MCO1655848.1 SAM-dependent methyltransferase [Pseudonocardia humida]